MVEMTGHDLVDAWLPTLLAPSASETSRDWAATLLRHTRTSAAPTYARALAVDLRAVLPTIDVPTLVVHGTDDARASRRVADELVSLVVDAELSVIDGAGHLVNVDAPEQFATQVRSFLTRKYDS